LLFAVVAGAVIAWYFLFRAPAAAEKRFADMLAHVPRDAQTLLVMDLEAIRASPHGPRLTRTFDRWRDELPPDIRRGLDEAGLSAGALKRVAVSLDDPSVLWDAQAGSWTVVCTGSFDPDKLVRAAAGLWAAVPETVGPARLVVGKEVGLALIDGEVLVLAPASQIRQRLAPSSGGAFAAIPAGLDKYLDRSDAIWGGTRIPGSIRLPLPGPSGKASVGVTHTAGSIRVGPGLDLQGGAQCTDPSTAATLRQLAENGISMLSVGSLLGSPGALERFVMSVRLGIDGAVLTGSGRLDAESLDELLRGVGL
jgi:hypothetical protein